MVVGFASFMWQGLNFGIDFRGGTTIRTEATKRSGCGRLPRRAGSRMSWAMCRSPRCSIRPSRTISNVAMIRIQAQDGGEAISGEMIEKLKASLDAAAPGIKFRVG